MDIQTVLDSMEGNEENGESIVEILDGTVTAFSHTFYYGETKLFFIELCSKGTLHHVLVKYKHQMHRRARLQILGRFRLTNLKKLVHHKPLPLLISKKKRSYLMKLVGEGADKDDLSEHSLEAIKGSLISYEGRVTKVMDATLGIFMLDESVQLVLTFLSNITCEVWNDYGDALVSDFDTLGVHVNESSSVEKAAFVNNYLKVGDQITVHHVHRLKISKKIILVACGRSLLIPPGDWKPALISEIPIGEDAILDVVHHWKFGARGLFWLIKLRNDLISFLSPEILHHDVIRRHKDQCRDSIIHEIVKASFALGLMTARQRGRRVKEEFMLHDQSCYLGDDFQEPFTLLKIEDAVISSNLRNSENQLHIQDWQSLQTPSFMVGKLRMSESGILQLVNKEGCIDCLIMGRSEQLLIDSVVALYNPSIAMEEFSIAEDDTYKKLPKKFLMVPAENVVVLHSSPKKVTKTNSFTNMKVILKSNLYFSNSLASHSSLKSNFIAKVIFSQSSHEGTNTWEGFVCISGQLAWAHSFFQEGYSYSIQTGFDRPEMDLRKTSKCNFLVPLYENFRTTECTTLPCDAVLIDMMPGASITNFVQVRSILNESVKCDGLISLQAVVKKTKFMTNKFDDSRQDIYPLEYANEKHVGVPGNKNMQILLSDCEDTETEIWLYVTAKPRGYHTPYPLGMLPGATIEVTYVKQTRSQKTRNLYLQSTGFTCLKPIKLPFLQDSSAGLCQSLKDNPKLPSVQGSSASNCQSLKSALKTQANFEITVDIVCAMYISMKPVCSGCNADMVNGQCSYVGCHHKGKPKVDTMAKLLVNDATEAATVILKLEDFLQSFLKLSDEKYETLKNTVILLDSKVQFSSMSRKKFSNPFEEVFHKLCTRRGLNRKVKLKGYKFKQQDERLTSLFGQSFSFCAPTENIEFCHRETET